MSITSWTSEGMIWEGGLPLLNEATLFGDYSSWRKYLVALQKATQERLIASCTRYDGHRYDRYEGGGYWSYAQAYVIPDPPETLSPLSSIYESNVGEWFYNLLVQVANISIFFYDERITLPYSHTYKITDYGGGFFNKTATDNISFGKRNMLYWRNYSNVIFYDRIKSALNVEKLVLSDPVIYYNGYVHYLKKQNLYLFTFKDALYQTYQILNLFKKTVTVSEEYEHCGRWISRNVYEDNGTDYSVWYLDIYDYSYNNFDGLKNGKARYQQYSGDTGVVYYVEGKTTHPVNKEIRDNNLNISSAKLLTTTCRNNIREGGDNIFLKYYSTEGFENECVTKVYEEVPVSYQNIYLKKKNSDPVLVSYGLISDRVSTGASDFPTVMTGTFPRRYDYYLHCTSVEPFWLLDFSGEGGFRFRNW